MTSPNTLSASEATTKWNKIDILLHEYDALRAEIRSTSSNIIQALVIAAIIITWLLSQSVGARFAILSGVTAIGLFVSLRAFTIQTTMLATRLCQIEAEVNGVIGAELLQWESHWGAAFNGGIRQMLFPRIPKKRRK